jgi:hypothetical protein
LSGFDRVPFRRRVAVLGKDASAQDPGVQIHAAVESAGRGRLQGHGSKAATAGELWPFGSFAAERKGAISVGVWSWMKSLTGQTERSPLDGKGEVPELVLLLDETLVVGVKFVQGAAQHALGVSLPTGEPDSTEFVTGESPIFFLQFGGRLLQIKIMPIPYFDKKVRPFVNGDPDRLAQTIQEPALKAAVARHQGWIAVSFMNAQAGNRAEDPYYHVGKMLSAFGMGEVAAIIWPARNAIRLWDVDMLEALEEGRPLELFGR